MFGEYGILFGEYGILFVEYGILFGEYGMNQEIFWKQIKVYFSFFLFV